MFDSVRHDMEKHTPEPPKMSPISEGEPLPPQSFNPNNSKQAPPFSGRRHTIADLWAPFSDGMHQRKMD
jgi:hypothetical protein